MNGLRSEAPDKTSIAGTVLSLHSLENYKESEQEKTEEGTNWTESEKETSHSHQPHMETTEDEDKSMENNQQQLLKSVGLVSLDQIQSVKAVKSSKIDDVQQLKGNNKPSPKFKTISETKTTEVVVLDLTEKPDVVEFMDSVKTAQSLMPTHSLDSSKSVKCGASALQKLSSFTTTMPFGASKARPLSNQVSYIRRGPNKYPDPDVVIGIVEPHIRISNRKRSQSGEDPMDLTAKKIRSNEKSEQQNNESEGKTNVSSAVDLSLKIGQNESATKLKSKVEMVNEATVETSPDKPINFSMSDKKNAENSKFVNSTKLWRSNSTNSCLQDNSTPKASSPLRRSTSAIPREKGFANYRSDQRHPSEAEKANISQRNAKPLSSTASRILQTRGPVGLPSHRNITMGPPTQPHSLKRQPETISPHLPQLYHPHPITKIREQPYQSAIPKALVPQFSHHHKMSRPPESASRQIPASSYLREQQSSMDLTSRSARSTRTEQHAAHTNSPQQPKAHTHDTVPLDLRTINMKSPKTVERPLFHLPQRDSSHPKQLTVNRNTRIADPISRRQQMQMSSMSTIHHQRHDLIGQTVPQSLPKIRPPYYYPPVGPPAGSSSSYMHRVREETRRAPSFHSQQAMPERSYASHHKEYIMRAPNVVVNHRMDPAQFQRGHPQQRGSITQGLARPPPYQPVAQQRQAEVSLSHEDLYALRSAGRSQMAYNSDTYAPFVTLAQTYPGVNFNHISPQQLSPEVSAQALSRSRGVLPEPPQLQPIPAQCWLPHH